MPEDGINPGMPNAKGKSVADAILMKKREETIVLWMRRAYRVLAITIIPMYVSVRSGIGWPFSMGDSGRVVGIISDIFSLIGLNIFAFILMIVNLETRETSKYPGVLGVLAIFELFTVKTGMKKWFIVPLGLIVLWEPLMAVVWWPK